MCGLWLEIKFIVEMKFTKESLVTNHFLEDDEES